MGSKGPSGNTTTTVQQQNPIATAQYPALSGLYGAADWQRTEPGAWNYINALGNYAGTQAGSNQALYGGVMPAAAQQYMNLVNQGMPAAGQANQLTANAGNAINQGLNFGQGLTNAANNLFAQAPGWQNAFMGAGQNALNTLQGYGGAATNALTGLAPGALSGMSNLTGQALANPALSSGLQGLASGAYINPSTNPAYAGMIQAATQPLVNQYQTATAPQVASQFEGAGRYGSGAQTNAQGQAQYGLGQGLGTAISGITNNAYNTGLNATLGAGSALGGIYNTGIANAGNILNQGYSTAGNLLNQGYATGGGLVGQGYSDLNAFMGNAANTALGYQNAGIQGLGAGASAAQQGYGTANTALGSAGNLLNLGESIQSGMLQQAPTFATYPEQQFQGAYNAPWLPLSQEAGILGGAVGGTGTSTTTQPYYSNTGANILSGLTGGLGAAAQLAPFLAAI